MLNNCRALDLSNENGFLCGKILADLGVDVIKVEKPGGDASRRIGPYWHDIPDPEKSLYWYVYNSNKRGITLDIETAEGQSVFRKLVQKADFVIESFPPGYLDKIGLGYSALSKIKNNIIMASITPFGQTGPYRDYVASDIVTMGMSGILYQTGDIELPPLHMSLPQACMLAGADAAAGSMIAYYHREKTGEGQYIDISMQHSAAWFLANSVPLWEMEKIVTKRAGMFRPSMNSTQRQVWQCKDGYVFFNIIGGRTGAKTLEELTAWMDSEGKADDYLKSLDFNTLDMFKVDQSVVDNISRPIEVFFKSHTKKEIDDGASKRRISVCPLSSMADLFNNTQLKYRDFWQDIEHPELKEKITYPKAFVQSSAEEFKIRFKAPLTGEHNKEVFSEIGLSETELAALKHAGII